MVLFDFDTPLNRHATNSLKWDLYAGRDVIPMWVADMDFRSPPAVIEALHARIAHGIFGYTVASRELREIVIDRLATRHAWKVQPEWIVWLPGLVTGLNVACRAVGAPGDAVLTTIPAYPPFLSAPALASRRCITIAHPVMNGRYILDFEGIERAITPDTRLFILCNPQNPTGRVFSPDELGHLAQICLRHGITLCSDEIHCDLVLDPDARHTSIAALDPDIAAQSITLLAPSKTYNIPGLGCSLAVIPDPDIRQGFLAAMQGIVPHVNALGYTAALAAYRDGEPWRLALIDYLRANRDLVEDTIARTPGLSMQHIEATYLAWIDAHALGAADPIATFAAAGLGLSNGAEFGLPGFVRLNFGCPRTTLQEGLQRLVKAAG